MDVTVRVKRLGTHDLPPPRYMSAQAAGMDLAACVDAPLVLAPGARVAVPTGFSLEIPPGFEGQVRPRSGLAMKSGITVVNAPGTIDSDYRGELKVLLVNLSDAPFSIARGERIAQLVIAPVVRATLELAVELSDTARGANGFGSSGT